MKKLFCILICLVFVNLSNSQQLAFPTAEGFGKVTTGGRGYPAYKVTNLNNNGIGSFRDAVSSPNRIVVFEVAGYIDLESTVIVRDNITIAGQTAFVNDGQGITIRKSSINPFSGPLLSGGNNNIIRYLRLRPGQRQDNDCCGDAIVFFQKSKIILDHISASFSSDEMVDFTESKIITIQNSFFTEPLSANNPATNGKIFQTGPTRNITFYRNIIANSGQRNPILSPLNGAPSYVEFVNNFSFNVGAFGLIVDATGIENTYLNVINNVWQSSVENYWSRRWVMLTARTGNQYYVSDNNIDSRYKPILTGDAWNLLTSEADDYGSNFSVPLPTEYQSLTPLSTPIVNDNVPLISAENIWDYVKDNSGVNLFRDAVDLRTISQIQNNSAPSNTPSLLDETDFGIAYSPLNNLSNVPTDSNNDGIPDLWENINMPPGATATDYALSGYTWLEEYINTLDSEDPTLSIPNNSIQSTFKIYLIYNILGQKLKELNKGINIVIYTNGSSFISKKIVKF